MTIRRFACVLAWALVVAASGCGQIAGLNEDDYTFTNDASTAGDGSGDSGPRPDASADGADTGAKDSGATCMGTEYTNAISDLGGDSPKALPLNMCVDCLAFYCCTVISDCQNAPESNGTSCGSEMSCVMGCERQTGTQNCLNTCHDKGQLFFDAIATCRQQNCAALCTAIQQ